MKPVWERMPWIQSMMRWIIRRRPRRLHSHAANWLPELRFVRGVVSLCCVTLLRRRHISKRLSVYNRHGRPKTSTVQSKCSNRYAMSLTLRRTGLSNRWRIIVVGSISTKPIPKRKWAILYVSCPFLRMTAIPWRRLMLPVSWIWRWAALLPPC